MHEESSLSLANFQSSKSKYKQNRNVRSTEKRNEDTEFNRNWFIFQILDTNSNKYLRFIRSENQQTTNNI